MSDKPAEDYIIAIRALSKIYSMGASAVEVLADVNLDVQAGTTVLVLGESGSGKSTLLNMIGGLDTPTHGSVSVTGTDIAGLPENALTEYRTRMVGFIFQFHYLLKDFSALENVLLPAMISGVKAKRARELARGLLEEVGLSHRKDHYPGQLSGGERQRAAVARALINSPTIILADEPTGNLDERNADVVLSLLFTLVKKYDKTMVMVTHERSIADSADRQYVLEHGVLSSL